MTAQALSLPSYIDSSTLSTWRSCRKKYFWSSLNALYPAGKSVHLIAGGAFAAGMEGARRMAFEGTGGSRPTRDDILQAATKAFMREWGDYIAPEGSNKSFDNTLQGLLTYLTEYPLETDVIQPYRSADGKPAVEFTFSVPIEEAPKHPETGDPILFVGRFDMLGDYNGLPCVVDEKTTSALGFAWADQWKLRGQFMGYCWACQQLGYPVNTACIRGIGLLKTEYKFATQIEQFSQHLIERWHQLLIKDVTAIVLAYKAISTAGFDPDNAFPFNFADACSSYGGCAFSALCLAKAPEDYFSNYIRHRWDPLAKQQVKELENAA